MAFTLKKAAPPAKAPAKKLATKKAPAKAAAPAKRAAPRRVEEDEAPAPRKKSAAKKQVAGAKRGMANSGWDGANELGGGGDFIKALDFAGHAEKTGGTLWFILKFVEEAPYANVKVHWLTKKGKRSYICVGDDCPLCDIGADVKTEMRFNVAVFTDSEPLLRSWSAGFKIYKKIKSYSEQPLTKPLPRRTYLATRTGVKFNEIAYDLARISDDEIGEGYPNIYIPSAAEIAELTPYTLDDVEKEYSTLEELEEVAADVVEGNDDEE